MKKHPAEAFLIATREEQATRMADMPPMVSVVPGGAGALLRRGAHRRIVPLWPPADGVRPAGEAFLSRDIPRMKSRPGAERNGPQTPLTLSLMKW